MFKRNSKKANFKYLLFDGVNGKGWTGANTHPEVADKINRMREVGINTVTVFDIDGDVTKRAFTIFRNDDFVVGDGKPESSVNWYMKNYENLDELLSLTMLTKWYT